MQYLDLQVVEQTLLWLQQRQTVWLSTVLFTYGSSPRAPGALFAATASGEHVGSLSGGCVEDDFLARLRDGEFNSTVSTVRYGDNQQRDLRVSLPCGGILEVLVEKLTSEPVDIDHMQVFLAALKGHKPLLRAVELTTGKKQFSDDEEVTGPRISRNQNSIVIRVGPAARLIIAGMSPVSEACAGFAVTLGFEVIICDPRESIFGDFKLVGVTTQSLMPSKFIATPGNCHRATAIVALTHDPRLDDLAMMDAVKTQAFYIGVMGSHRTSQNREQRLRKSGGLTKQQIARIQMPIGLALGSKTPAEIALAVMADVVRTLRGKQRSEL